MLEMIIALLLVIVLVGVVARFSGPTGCTGNCRQGRLCDCKDKND
jgi:hypothetical protein